MPEAIQSNVSFLRKLFWIQRVLGLLSYLRFFFWSSVSCNRRWHGTCMLTYYTSATEFTSGVYTHLGVVSLESVIWRVSQWTRTCATLQSAMYNAHTYACDVRVTMVQSFARQNTKENTYLTRVNHDFAMRWSVISCSCCAACLFECIATVT